jgi:hypothetical protein
MTPMLRHGNELFAVEDVEIIVRETGTLWVIQSPPKPKPEPKVIKPSMSLEDKIWIGAGITIFGAFTAFVVYFWCIGLRVVELSR